MKTSEPNDLVNAPSIAIQTAAIDQTCESERI
jgi:hypothetical protein